MATGLTERQREQAGVAAKTYDSTQLAAQIGRARRLAVMGKLFFWTQIALTGLLVGLIATDILLTGRWAEYGAVVMRTGLMFGAFDLLAYFLYLRGPRHELAVLHEALRLREQTDRMMGAFRR